jgi:predicted GIY-YIG superfamily endonuclease
LKNAGFGGQCQPIQQFWYVYILDCGDGRQYTGCTNDLESRLKRHKPGQIQATRDRLPVRLMTYIAFNDKYKAYYFEKYLKK